MSMRTGAELLCDALTRAGVEGVFGVPGTQTVEIYETLRTSRIRSIVPTHELAAAFMANGYARASGKPGVLLTISGPGVAFAPAGLAEAKLDGVALVHFTITPALGPTGEPSFQSFDQAAFARPLVKATLRATETAQVGPVVREALALATARERGPVFVELAPEAIRGSAADVTNPPISSNAPTAASSIEGDDSRALDPIVAALSAATRPVLFVACDCGDAATPLADAAAKARMPMLIPAPHRGVVAEDHPWMLCCDDQRTSFDRIQEVVSSADLVVVLGTKLSHITTAGFRLKLAPERVACIAATGNALPHGYVAGILAAATPAQFAERLAAAAQTKSTWSADQVTELRQRFSMHRPADPPEPLVDGADAAAFFTALRAALPRQAILVTDSGLHQVLARRHFPVLAPNGFIFPSEFQSMGFGLPAAIGAKLGAPDRPVVAVIGDGGFLMSGLELATAVRASVPVVVIVFNDGQLNLIRLQQIREFGRVHGVGLLVPDLERFAASIGIRYAAASGDIAGMVRAALLEAQPTLIEVAVGDSPTIARVRAKSFALETARRTLGRRLLGWLKSRLR